MTSKSELKRLKVMGAIPFTLDDIDGCMDGNCIVRKPVGMHTNGGCNCARDNLKLQKIVQALKNEIVILKEGKS